MWKWSKFIGTLYSFALLLISNNNDILCVDVYGTLVTLLI